MSEIEYQEGDFVQFQLNDKWGKWVVGRVSKVEPLSPLYTIEHKGAVLQRRGNGMKPVQEPATPTSRSLADLRAEVYALNKSKGWFDQDREFGTGIALLMSEAAEALDAHRRYGMEKAEEAELHFDSGGGGRTVLKPVDVGSEFADVLIRLLDMCQRYNVDLEAEYDRKMAYNQLRPVHHGGKAY